MLFLQWSNLAPPLIEACATVAGRDCIVMADGDGQVVRVTDFTLPFSLYLVAA
jgi:hypothetical protein